jgi:hypothetical protein
VIIPLISYYDEICITVTFFRRNRRKKGKKGMETAAFWVNIEGIRGNRVQDRSMFNSRKKEKVIN